MGKYLQIRCKQLIRLLPWVLAAALLLAAAGAVAGTAAVRQNAEGTDNQKYTVALCGVGEDPLLQLGITALQSLDETRFSVNILCLAEPEAEQALESGRIDGYVLIPEGFLTSALGGNVPTLRFVTAREGTAVQMLFQKEITDVIGQILLSAQRGSYGAYYALMDSDAEEQALPALNELCMEYVELAIDRGQAYELRVLGVGSGLALEEYLLCGLSVLLVFLLCLPFTVIFVQTDASVGRMLAARGCGATGQAVIDFACMLLGLWTVLGAIFLLVDILGISLPFAWYQVLPVAFLAASIGFLLNSLARELISGVLAQFFVAAAMCFVSGCMYPVFFFPVSVQQLAAWLPAGICREYLAACVTGEMTMHLLLSMLLPALATGAAAVWIRRGRIVYAKGAVR